MTATPEQITAALAFKDGARKTSFRFDRLDKDRAYVGPLESVLSGEVSNNAFADIKRTAKFTILDDGSINYLSDMIQPYFCLSVPQPPTWIAGDVVDRVNSNVNPRMENSIVGWSVGASSPQTAAAGGTVVNFTTGVTTSYAIIFQTALVGAAGESWGGLIDVTVPVGYPAVTLGLTSFSYGNNIPAAGANVTINPGETKTLYSAINPLVSGTIGVRTILYSRGAITSGSRIIVRNAQLERVAAGVTQVGPFFSGATVDSVGPGFSYNWTGTANNSTSERRENVRVNTPDEIVEWPLGVFQLTSPTRAYRDGNYIVRDVEAYDLLLTLRDDKTADRYVLGVGANYTTAVAQILQAEGFYQNVTPSSLTVPATMEWEPGTSYLRIVNDILGAINYDSVFFDETGVCICRPYQSPVDRPILYDYTADADSIIAGDIDQTLDLFGVPNKWVLVKSEPDQPSIKGTYTNSSISSPTSTVSRGRTIVDFSTEEEAANVGTLNALAKRKAFEASQVYEVVEFESAGMPFHGNYSVIMLTIDDLAIGDRYSEHEWTLPLQAGELMSHKVRRVVTV